MKEYIMPIDDTAIDWDEMFVGVIRKQEELIRCKDCEYRTGEGSCWWHADNSTSYSTELYSIYSWYVDDNDFCSKAERKEE